MTTLSVAVTGRLDEPEPITVEEVRHRGYFPIYDLADSVQADLYAKENLDISHMITAVREQCEKYTNRMVIGADIAAALLYESHEMRGYLPYPPVREVGSVTPSFSHNPLPATDYTLGPGSMLIIDHAGHGCDWGPAAYNVAYESGYPEDQVPTLLRQSLLEYVSAMWDKRDGNLPLPENVRFTWDRFRFDH